MPQKYQEIIELLLQYRHVIWDWNGTLLNDSQIVLEANNILLREHSLPEITLDDYRAKFTHPVIDYYKELGFDVSEGKFAAIGQRFIDLYAERLDGAQVFQNIPEILGQLQGAGIGQSILSAAHEPKLRKWVVERKLDSYFDRVFGISDIYAASKIERGQQLLKEVGLSSSQVIMVGDTDHDHEVADALGIHIALIANGHQSKERLAKLTDFVFY